MSKMAIKTGGRVSYTAGATITVGDFVVAGSLCGWACDSVVSGEVVELQTEGEGWINKEATTDTFAVGALVNWDVADGEANADSTNNDTVAICTEAALATDTHVRCKLIGFALGTEATP